MNTAVLRFRSLTLFTSLWVTGGFLVCTQLVGSQSGSPAWANVQSKGLCCRGHLEAGRWCQVGCNGSPEPSQAVLTGPLSHSWAPSWWHSGCGSSGFMFLPRPQPSPNPDQAGDRAPVSQIPIGRLALHRDVLRWGFDLGWPSLPGLAGPVRGHCDKVWARSLVTHGD